MQNEVRVEVREAVPTAAARRTARPSEISKAVRESIGETWTYLRAAGTPKPGRNTVLYLDGAINLEGGAEVDQPFQGNESVVCSCLPAGRVAYVDAPLREIHAAHSAVLNWCREQGHALAGPSWEIYGHWVEDADKMTVQICYLLTPCNG